MAISAVAGLATAIGAAAAAGGITGALVFFGLKGWAAFAAWAALGAGLSMVSRALAPKPNLGAQLRGITQTTREPAGPRKMVYGKMRVGGQVVFISHSGDDNKYLNMAIAFASHEIESFEEIWFNDKRVWTTSGFNSDWGTYVTIDRKLGTATQTASTQLKNAHVQWTDDHKLSGIAYIAFRLEWNADKFPQGVPNITAVIKGKKVYDPRDSNQSATDSSTWTFSQNPALCLRDYLVDEKYGLGEDRTLIDSTALTAAANLCDETQENNADIYSTSGQKRYQLNGVIDAANNIKDNIEQMLSAMGGNLTYSGGKYFIKGAEYVAPTVTFDEADCVSEITVQTRQSRRGIYNGVKGIFVAESKNWKVLDYPAQISKTDAGSFVTGTKYQILHVGNTDFTAIGAASNAVGVQFTATGAGSGTGSASASVVEDGAQILLDMPLPFVTNEKQAQLLAKLALLRSRQQTVLQVTVNLKGLQVKVGDTINLTNTRLGYSSKIFEVIEYNLTATEQGPIGVELTLIETGAAVYDWTSNDEEDFLEGGELDLYDGRTVDNVTSLSHSVTGLKGPDGKNITTVDFTWTAPTDAFVEFYIVTLEKDDDGNVFEYQTREPRLRVPNLDIGSAYEVIVKAQNLIGVRSSGTTLDIASLAGDTTAPSKPTNMTAVGGVRQITVQWDDPSDEDFALTRIFVANSDSIPATSSKTRGSEFVYTLADDEDGEVTKYFWLKSEDYSGNVSAATASFTGTSKLAASDDVNIDADDVGLGDVENRDSQDQVETGIETGATVTTGGITLDGGGSIKGGQTEYDDSDAAGFFLGYSGSAYKFSIGNADNSKKLTFDGSDLLVTGAIKGGSIQSNNTDPIPTDVFTRTGNTQNIPTGDESGAFIDLASGSFLFGDADSFVSFAENSDGTAFELDIKGVLAPTTLDFSAVTDTTVMPSNIKAQGYVDASIGVDAISDAVWNEIDSRVGQGSGGFYTSATANYLGAASQYITIGTTQDHGTEDITVKVVVSDTFAYPRNFAVGNDALKIKLTLQYKVASGSTWVTAGSTQTRTLTPTLLQYATRYTIDESYSVTLTSGAGNDIADDTDLDFRVKLERVGSQSAFADYNNGGANDTTGTPVVLEVSENASGVSATGGNADTLDNIDSTGFFRLGASGSTVDNTAYGDQTFTGDVTVTGTLNLQGSIDQYNVTDLDVTDKTITVNSGNTQALSDGAGLIVDRGTASDAFLKWDETNEFFDLSHDLQISKGLAQINLGHSGGPHGINFYDDGGALTWGFYYRTSPDTLSFEHQGTSAKFTLATTGALTLTGAVTWSGGGSANANTAYTYSQVGHLPLAGGTITGNVTTGAKVIFSDSTFTTYDWQQYQGSTGPLLITISGTGGPEFQFAGDGSDYENATFSVGGADVTATKIGNWNTAYGWGDHSAAGYLTSLAFNDLTGKTSGTGDYSTSGDLVSGRGSGGVALTINDGYGNANVTFNHQNGVPEQNGNAGRIEVNTDSSTGASMYFEVKSGVTANTAVQTTSIFRANETGLYMESGKVIYGNGGVNIQANDDDFVVKDTTDSTTNFIWRDHSASKLYLGTSTASVELRSDLNLQSGHTIKHNGTTVIDSSRNHYALGTASNSAPRYTFSGDTDTGLGYIGADQVGLIAGGSRKFYVGTTSAYFQNLTGGVNLPKTIIAHSESSGMKLTATDSTADASFYGFHIDYNASGSDTTTADRAHAAIYIDADSSATGGGTSHEHRFYGVYSDVRASGDSDVIISGFHQSRVDNFGTGSQVTNVRGLQGNAIAHQDAGIVSANTGVYGQGQNYASGSGEVHNTYGGYFVAYAASSSSYASENYIGVRSFAQISATQTHNLNQAVAVWGEIQLDNDTAADHDVTISSAMVFRAEYDENDSDDSYTVNTGYLYYGNYAGELPTTAWGVYIADAVENYFGGGVQVRGDLAVGSSSDASRYIKIDKATTGENGILFRNGGSNKIKILQDSSEHLRIYTNNTGLRMSILEDGTILAGKSASGFGTAGAEINVGGTAGKVQFTRASNQPLSLNRTGSEGAILSLYQDSTAVGSIGTKNATLTIGSGDAGILFNASSNAVYPWNISTNSASDGVLDLGIADRRWKDLFLSGEVSSATIIASNTSSGSTTQIVSLVNPVGTANTGVRLWMSGTNTTTRGAFIDAVAESTSNNHSLRFGVSANSASPTERFRINSSGTALFGKTAEGTSNNGVELRQSGYIFGTTNGTIVARFNRRTSNGDVVEIRKDNSLVGTVGIEGGDSLYIQSGTTSGSGLRFHPTGGVISPVRNGNVSSNTISLGSATQQFKDLHLGGDAYLSVGKKLYFGGGSHTYISEDIDDRMRFFVGGSEFMRFTEAASDSINLFKATEIASTLTMSGGNINLRNNTSGDGVTIRDITFMTTAAEGTDDRVAIVRGMTNGGTSTTRGGKLVFYTRKANDAGFNGTTLDQAGNLTLVSGAYLALSDTNTKVAHGGGNAVRLQTNSGYIDVGPQNTTWAHIQTDRGKFYFNKQITVDSGVVSSYNEDLQLRRADSTTARIRVTSSDVRVDTSVLSVSADGGSGYVASRMRLETHNDYRGAGVYMRDTTDGDQWFAGTPYTGHDDTYVIAFQSAVTSDVDQTAQNTHAKLRVQADGLVQVGSATTNGRLYLSKADNNVSDHLMFYVGNTRVGEIGAEDTNWLRINQVTAKNIYTPRLFRADGGLQTYDGTVSAPSFTFKDDTNTGFFRYGGDVIGVTTGGTRRARFGSTIYLESGDVRINANLYHNGDTDTRMNYTTDRIRFFAGGVEMLDMVEGGTDYVDIVDRVRVTAGGNLECEGNLIAYSTTSISDINQKENIDRIKNPIDKVKQISGYTFDWKTSGEQSGGVIAQEIEKVLPSVVKETSIRDGAKIKAVDYQAIIGLLVETVKDLNERIEELENGNNED